ncbi:MAG TPA: NADH-ubiquinone oxidoreductase-F iron-sulfur binding region domain-containing protein [Trebonia sp.]
MTTAVNEPFSARRAGPPMRPCRLLPPRPEGLSAHLRRLGPVPYRGRPGLLIREVEAAGLTGRGGAAFPVHRKLAVVAARPGHAVIVANGAESEPASRKDAFLLRVAPHLILDGLQLAAEAVGADEAYLYVHRGTETGIARALADRAALSHDRLPVTIAEAPPRFLAGQESALVNWLGGGPVIPTFSPPRVSERGLEGAPTLVQNVETLAHLALIARFGPRWFRAAGTRTEPGTMLVTLHHQDGRCRIAEARFGTPLSALLSVDARVQAWLVGGYHGTWLPVSAAGRASLDNGSLRGLGASVGAGVLAALPADSCGLVETARVAGYLAAESAGQCGPCLNGLPRIAAALAELARPRPRRAVRADIERWAGLVKGRGACSHPDGTARFVRSALTVFQPELARHEHGRCSAANCGPFLPLPADVPVHEEDWM